MVNERQEQKKLVEGLAGPVCLGARCRGAEGGMAQQAPVPSPTMACVLLMYSNVHLTRIPQTQEGCGSPHAAWRSKATPGLKAQGQPQ